MRYSVGDICYNSHQWWQDDPEDDVKKVIEKSKMYFGEYITLIAGDYAEGGNDMGEIIISDAEVIAIIK